MSVKIWIFNEIIQGDFIYTYNSKYFIFQIDHINYYYAVFKYIITYKNKF